MEGMLPSIGILSFPADNWKYAQQTALISYNRITDLMEPSFPLILPHYINVKDE